MLEARACAIICWSIIFHAKYESLGATTDASPSLENGQFQHILPKDNVLRRKRVFESRVYRSRKIKTSYYDNHPKQEFKACEIVT